MATTKKKAPVKKKAAVKKSVKKKVEAHKKKSYAKAKRAPSKKAVIKKAPAPKINKDGKAVKRQTPTEKEVGKVVESRISRECAKKRKPISCMKRQKTARRSF